MLFGLKEPQRWTSAMAANPNDKARINRLYLY
jgi:hypothetical protein